MAQNDLLAVHSTMHAERILTISKLKCGFFIWSKLSNINLITFPIYILINCPRLGCYLFHMSVDNLTLSHLLFLLVWWLLLFIIDAVNDDIVLEHLQDRRIEEARKNKLNQSSSEESVENVENVSDSLMSFNMSGLTCAGE